MSKRINKDLLTNKTRFMKSFNFLGMTLVVMIMSVNFAACNDDNKEDNIPLTEKLVGQWILTYEEGWYKSLSFPEDNHEWSHAPEDVCEWFGNFTFRADGTFTEYELNNLEITNGKWALSNSLLTLRENGLENEPKDLKVVEISTNKLVLECHDKGQYSEEYAKMTYRKK